MDHLLIRRNRIVHLALEVTDSLSGEVLERALESEQHFVYLHGHNNVLTDLEATLTGRQAGDSFDVTIPLAYGERQDDAIVVAKLSDLDLPAHCGIGSRVSASGPNGAIELTVIALHDNTVTLDANHPLAGRTLRYTGEVIHVKKAHKDEIRHHRPHPAGHHLMMQDSSFSGIMVLARGD